MIHQYKLNGYSIVVDANSASVHTVDDAAYDMISILDEGLRSGADAAGIFSDVKIRSDAVSKVVSAHNIPVDDAEEIFDDLAELYSEGLLWSDDPYEEAAGELKIKQSVLKAISIG